MRDHAASTALRHFACRRGSEDAQRRSRDEMALKVEIVVDGSVHTGKAPGGSSRFEPLHFCALVVAPPDTSFLHDCSSGAPVRGDMPAADAATPRRRNAVCRSPDGPRRRGGAVPAARTSPSGRQQARDTFARRRCGPPSRPDAIGCSAEGAAGAAVARSRGRILVPCAAPFHTRCRALVRPGVPRRLDNSG